MGMDAILNPFWIMVNDEAREGIKTFTKHAAYNFLK